ncbi:MAG: hypothetical protein ACOCUD_04210 [Bacillota bacterium]
MDSIKASSDEEVIKAKKTNKQDMLDSLELFDEDPAEFDIDKEIISEFKIPKDTTDHLLRISNIIKIELLVLEGYKEIPSGNTETVTYKLVTQPLCSSHVIKTFEAILKTYSGESNILSKMNWDSFEQRAKSDYGAFYKYCLREQASPEKSLRTVLRTFQGCILSIGEIICDNPQNMNKVFGTDFRRHEDELRGGNVYR